MQRFQKSEQGANAARRYDSDAVRHILARASEIESRTEPDPLTEEQVEALGREVGLSPEAVRRALRKKIGVEVGHETARETRLLPPITRSDVRSAAQSGLLYSVVALVAMAATLVVGHYSNDLRYVSPAYWLMAAGLVIFCMIYLFLCPLLFPFLYGWRRRDWRQGLLLTLALIPMYAVAFGVAVLIVVSQISIRLEFGGVPYVPLSVASIASGIVGGLAGRWWHDRSLAEER